MTAPSSLTARFAAARQSAKNTPATTGFITGIMHRSYLYPDYNYITSGPEHSGGAVARPTARKANDYRQSYVHLFGGEGRMYPALVGVLLRGAGFGVATVNNTTYKTHTFKIAARDAAAWLSIMHQLGEGSDQFERKASDARVSRLTLAAGRDGLNMDFEGMALSEAQSAGTETLATDDNVPMMPNTGSLALTVGGTNIVAACKSNEMVINNPLSRDEFFLFGFGNADLPQTGISITGTIGDVDLSFDLYKRLNWGGASGTDVVNTTLEGALSYTYQSAVNIGGASVPYSLSVSVPTAMITPATFQAQDDNLIRVGLTWEMVDTGAEPITITLSNKQTAY